MNEEGGGEEEEGRRDAFILGLLEMNLRYGVRSVVNCWNNFLQSAFTNSG